MGSIAFQAVVIPVQPHVASESDSLASVVVVNDIRETAKSLCDPRVWWQQAYGWYNREQTSDQ